jgi:glycerophosphoryl diester phosphodiesterase
MSFLDFVDLGINTYFACRPRKNPPQTRLDHVKLIAHRGAHGRKSQCIENTDAAFALALQLGCWGIELDVHVTADGVVVVHHDPDLNRLWGVNLAIRDITFQQLRACAPLVPSLAEVVQRYGQSMHLFIELKAPITAERELLTILQPLTPCVNYHIISLDEATLATLSGFPTKSLLLVAQHNNTKRFCELSLQNNYGGVLGHYL